MKLKLQLMAIATSAAFVSHAPAAYVVTYNTATYTYPNPNLAAYDWEDHLTPSQLQGSGSVTKFAGGAFNFQGYGPALNPEDYVGFSVRIDDGYQLNLTDLTYTTFTDTHHAVLGVRGGNEFQWGYRIDSNNDGVFEQDWVFGPLHLNGAAGSGNGTTKQWDFADFSTTGTVEFGLFASADDGTKTITALNGSSSLFLNGTVTPAVPEPSSMLLGAVGGLALLRRRRQSN